MADLKNFVSDTATSFLNEFFAPLKDDNGVALPSRYEVMFFVPTGTRGSAGNTLNTFAGLINDVTEAKPRDVSLQCNKIEFPGLNIDSTPDTNIYGPTREVMNGFTYGDISAKFYCHNDMREKKFFETWQRLAFNPQTFAVNYYDDYTGTIQIFQLDQRNNRRYGCELVECFPKVIGDQALSGAPADSAQEVDITFTYRYWKTLN